MGEYKRFIVIDTDTVNEKWTNLVKIRCNADLLSC